jgi:tRNA(fMet)-specific endonuclease VapC
MRFLLDTNTCIIYLRGRNLGLKQRLESVSQEVAVCSIVKAELFYGAMKSAKPDQNLRFQNAFLAQFTSLPFDDSAATLFGQIRSQLESRGTPIGAYDLQIAAIALAHNLTLVTHNTHEFSRVEGLPLVDWEAEIP